MSKEGILAKEAKRQELLQELTDHAAPALQDLFREYGEIAYQANLHKAALMQLEEALEEIHTKLAKLQSNGDYRKAD